MLKKRLLLSFIAMVAILVFLKVGLTMYRCLVVQDQEDERIPARSKRYKTEQKKQPEGGYGFGRMLALVEACQKVKDLEHLYLVHAVAGEPRIDSQTIRDLIKSLAQERVKFMHHVDNLKARAREPLSTKKMRSLTFYLHVLEECIQDMEIIIMKHQVLADKK